jgi:hypothetical protein
MARPTQLRRHAQALAADFVLPGASFVWVGAVIHSFVRHAMHPTALHCTHGLSSLIPERRLNFAFCLPIPKQ